MVQKKLSRKRKRSTKRTLKLNDTFNFEGTAFKISHISEIGVRAEEIDKPVKGKELRILYWFGVEHFEKETGFKVNTKGGFPVPIEPHRYVVSPEGFGEIVKVKNNYVNVRLFNSDDKKGRRKTATFTHDQLRSLSQSHPQLSNAGSYIKGVERITVLHSNDLETKATIEVVRDLQDQLWRYGIEFQLPTTRGGIRGPSKFHSKKFYDRRKAVIAAVRDLEAVMREEVQRVDTSSEQKQKIYTAIKEMGIWLQQQVLKSKVKR